MGAQRVNVHHHKVADTLHHYRPLQHSPLLPAYSKPTTVRARGVLLSSSSSLRISHNKSSNLESGRLRPRMSGSGVLGFGTEGEVDAFVQVGNKLADAAGEVIRKYFRKPFEILDKDDLSPVTIADRAAEESMVSIILENFPSHAIYGEENGWICKEKTAEYVWVLDPIDGTKSFITGKPLFGTLIALLHKGTPILGIIDQPVLRERWIGMSGRETTLNGKEVSTRICSELSQAYLYTTSPHLFSGDAEKAFALLRSKVKAPLYGCDCYAYALLASGFVDLVVESGLKPYDFLSLVPVIEGAGGVITDWNGDKLNWEATSDSFPTRHSRADPSILALINPASGGNQELHLNCISDPALGLIPSSRKISYSSLL